MSDAVKKSSLGRLIDAIKKSKLGQLAERIGLPTLIIAIFWVLVLVLGAFNDISIITQISDTIKRFGMNGILVLAMVPSIQSGTGPNFALPISISCGLLAMVITIELGFSGMMFMLFASLLAILFAVIMGFVYGLLLNAVKGSEMTIATYTGFSMTALMCLVWLMVPFKDKRMGWMMGEGLRETIQLEGVGAAQILNKWLGFRIGGIEIPTGMLLILFLFCILVWLFFRTKSGIAISAAGINPMFAKASGLNIDRARITANVFSTVLGALGIIVYSQSYGFMQLYNGPLLMAFPAVAAVLIGGATAQRAKVSHVLIGTLLFQGLMTSALPVTNKLFMGTDLSEPIRAVIQNGIILYALTKVKGGAK